MALYHKGKNISKYIQNHVFKLRARWQSSPPPVKNTVTASFVRKAESWNALMKILPYNVSYTRCTGIFVPSTIILSYNI